MGTFVVVYYGATGSSWLMNVLGSIPGVLVAAYEPVESWHWDGPEAAKLAWLRTALDPPDSGDAAAVARWEQALRASPQFQRLARPRFHTVGFKMTAAAITDRAALLDLVDERGTRLVVLARRNRIKHALSLYRSHEEAKNQFRFEDLAPASRVEPATFAGWVEHATGWAQRTDEFRMAATGRLGPERVLAVHYEDFVTPEGKTASLRTVCGFLGLDVDAIRSDGGYRKATPDDLRQAIVNYDEIAARYAATPLAADFE